jgi:hypothetical protein
VIDIPPELADEINRQVKSGKYKSPQDFMLAAVQNQTYLETVETDGDSLVTHQPVMLPFSATFPMPKTAEARLILPPNLAQIRSVPITPTLRHNYLPGFTNRLFPVKLILRVLGNLVEQSGSQYIPLGELNERSAEVARELGKVIQKKDRTMGRKRGTIISAGLPVGREDKAKSRFENQFVGFMGKEKVEGAAPTLRFVDMIKEGDSTLVGITDAGLKFSALSNPILDKQDYAIPFSEEEVAFLLNHIPTTLEAERSLMGDILKAVHEGDATPDEMTQKVESWRRRQSNHLWTENQVLAMRVGIISRMNELGLVERHKNGVNVTYRLTTSGTNYLRRLTEMTS